MGKNKFDKEIEKLYGIVEQIDDTTYVARKDVQKRKIEFEKNHLYLIRIDPSDTARNLLQTTAVNWNSGRQMRSSYLKCEYVGDLGNMVKINGRGFSPSSNLDTDDIYLNYWLDKSVVEIIREIN